MCCHDVLKYTKRGIEVFKEFSLKYSDELLKKKEKPKEKSSLLGIMDYDPIINTENITGFFEIECTLNEFVKSDLHPILSSVKADKYLQLNRKIIDLYLYFYFLGYFTSNKNTPTKDISKEKTFENEIKNFEFNERIINFFQILNISLVKMDKKKNLEKFSLIVNESIKKYCKDMNKLKLTENKIKEVNNYISLTTIYFFVLGMLCAGVELKSPAIEII